MQTQTQQTGVIPFTTADLKSAGAVYNTAIGYEDKYRATQANLLALAKQSGEKLSKEIDDKLMAWQVSAKKAAKAIEEQRKPFTEKAHGFIKAFTAIENTLLKELYDPIQQARDVSARIHAEEAAAARAKEQAELAAKQKRIDDIANLETQLRNGYAALLSETKRTILHVYTKCSLEQAGEAKLAIQSFINCTMFNESWETIALVGDQELIDEVRTEERFNACSNHFSSEVAAYAEYILEMFPARVAELEQGIADNKAAEELRKRQEEEAAQAAKDAQARADAEAARKKQAANVTVMVAQANREVETPKAIESYAVVVGSVDGWRAVVEYYLSNSGVSADDLGKTKLDSMRAFAERQAKATGEMVEHVDVVYEPKYKAVARATRKKVA